MMNPKFRCAQEAAIAAMQQLWENCNTQVATFNAYKAFYTTGYCTTQKAAIEAAAALPDNDARRTIAESIRIDLVAQAKLCRNLWQDLKAYIRSAYPADQFDTKLTAAGWSYYPAASGDKWTSMQSLMNNGLNFMNINSTELMNNGNMPAAFTTAFANAQGYFNTLFAQFVTALQTAETQTDERMEALNTCYENTINMCLDGQNAFRDNPSLKNQFVFDSVCSMVDGTSPAKLDGYATYIINGQPVVGLTAEIESINKSVQTNELGFYDFGPLKGGNTYTVKYILDGEIKDTESVKVNVGTGARKNVEIAT